MPKIKYRPEKVKAERVQFLDNREAEVLKEAPNLRPLRNRLVGLLGRWVILPVIEEDLENILKRGELLCGRRPRMMKGEPSQCHTNVAFMWDANRDKVVLMTGYAMSRDGVWRQHSWGFVPKSKKVIETTERRVAYYGYKMTPDEAEQFLYEND